MRDHWGYVDAGQVVEGLLPELFFRGVPFASPPTVLVLDSVFRKKKNHVALSIN